jgi:hypothetical protein
MVTCCSGGARVKARCVWMESSSRGAIGCRKRPVFRRAMATRRSRAAALALHLWIASLALAMTTLARPNRIMLSRKLRKRSPVARWCVFQKGAAGLRGPEAGAPMYHLMYHPIPHLIPRPGNARARPRHPDGAAVQQSHSSCGPARSWALTIIGSANTVANTIRSHSCAPRAESSRRTASLLLNARAMAEICHR